MPREDAKNVIKKSQAGHYLTNFIIDMDEDPSGKLTEEMIRSNCHFEFFDTEIQLGK
jgi:hypothetical protein